MIDTNTYTLFWPGQGAAAADLSGAGVALDAATEVNFLIVEPSDLIEVGVYITVTTGADTFAFTVTKAQTTAAASDLTVATSPNLCIVTGPAGAAIAVGRCLRRYKDGPVTGGLYTAPPVLIPLPSTIAAAGAASPFGAGYDQWHFERGDVLVYTVSDTAAAGALGIFYARFQRTGAQRTNRKPVITPVGGPITTIVDTQVDLDSTT